MSTNNQAISDPMVCENGLALSPKAIDFSEKSIRRGFIRKVYGILMCQFLLMTGIIAFFLFYERNNLFILYRQCISYVQIFDVIFTVIILTCVCMCRQTAPCNYIILFTFTVAIAITIGMLAHLADAPEVLIAVGVAAGVCLGITIFISLTKWDFTLLGGWLLTTILVLFLYGVIALSVESTRTTLMLILGIAVLVYSLYIVYDIRLMVKGKHWFRISPEEYVFAALHLNLVIIYLLLFVIVNAILSYCCGVWPVGYSVPENFGEDGQVQGFDFSEKSIRRAFIRKVYAILMCQLLITMGFISLFLFHEPTKNWVAQNSYLFWVALAVLFVCLIVMACCENVRRKTPMNFIFLAIFTLAQSFLLGVATSVYSVSEVMMAVGITAGVSLALTLFAFQTKWDFTMMGGALVAATMVLLMFGLIALIFPRNNIVTLVYAALGALIFSLYLVYDTQLMMGGKHKYSISPEEYIFAALNLYLDIVNIFLYILTIIGATR